MPSQTTVEINHLNPLASDPSPIRRQGHALRGLAILLLALPALIVHGASKNSFDLSGALVPADEILAGGPPRDGIPAIDRPRFVAAAQATGLRPSDRVLGLNYRGISKAYPIAILNWHEIVNDRFDDKAVVISFCPLCGTGMAFSARTRGQSYHFGVSGLLYNSDVLFYDRETASLWSQLLAQAVSGPLKGTHLTQLPLTHTTWRDWRKRHQDTLVLSRDTGYRRDYDRDPYAGYTDSRGIFFPVRHKDPRFHPKARVLGIAIAGRYKAYPFSELARSPGVVEDRFATKNIRILYDKRSQSASAQDEDGRELVSTTGFWFAWYAFHPNTLVYRYQPETQESP